MTTREDILSLAEDLEDGVQRNGSMDGEDGAVDLYDIDAANEVMGEAAKMLRTLAAPTPPAAEATQADMAAFGASDVACYLYPDSGKERAAFIAGAAHAAEATGQEPVAVKPLEWVAGDGVSCSEECWHAADGWMGRYTVIEGQWFHSRFMELGCFASDGEAKAAAQANYEQRIRSALISAPPTYADAEAKGQCWRSNLENAWAALRMIREAVETFGPVTSLDGEDAILLRGPEPVHEAEAIVEAILRLKPIAELAASEPAVWRYKDERAGIWHYVEGYEPERRSIREPLYAGTAIRSLASPAPKGET